MLNSKVTFNTGGLIPVQLILLILKLVNFISWSWYLIFIPGYILMVMLLYFLFIIHAIKKR